MPGTTDSESSSGPRSCAASRFVPGELCACGRMPIGVGVARSLGFLLGSGSARWHSCRWDRHLRPVRVGCWFVRAGARDFVQTGALNWAYTYDSWGRGTHGSHQNAHIAETGSAQRRLSANLDRLRKLVKLFREKAGMTRQELGDAIGYSGELVASWNRLAGRRRPRSPKPRNEC